jgi:hypothetical protein
MNKIVSVIFTNVLNTNGRIYDIQSCNKIIEDFKNRKCDIYGELGHPDEFDVSLSNVSHVVKDMWLNKNNILMAEIEILDTVKGKMLKELYENMVFSTRSYGSVDPTSKKVAIEKFITIDAIDSKSDAYLKQRLREKKLKRILKYD